MDNQSGPYRITRKQEVFVLFHTIQSPETTTMEIYKIYDSLEKAIAALQPLYLSCVNPLEDSHKQVISDKEWRFTVNGANHCLYISEHELN